MKLSFLFCFKIISYCFSKMISNNDYGFMKRSKHIVKNEYNCLDEEKNWNKKNVYSDEFILQILSSAPKMAKT